MASAGSIAPDRPDAASAWRNAGNAAIRAASWATPVIVAIVVLLPVVLVFYGSFRSGAPGNPEATFTLDKWLRVYGSPFYHAVFLNTLALSTVTAFMSVVIGGVLAWIVARTDAPWRGAMSLLFIIPLMISNLITTLAWIALAAPNAGFINILFRNLFGVRTLFDIYSFSGIVLVMTLNYASFAFLTILGALRAMDSSLEEAAYMTGANPLRTARTMTLPLIWPSIASAFLMTFILAAENFSIPTLLGAPVGFQTLTTRIYYDMTVEPADPTLAAASGTMLLWIAILGIIWQRRILKNANRFVTVSGKGSRSHITRLGPWRYVATAVLVFYFLIAVAIPYATLVLGSFMSFLTPRINPRVLTLDNYTELFSGRMLGVLQNSVVYSLGGGLVFCVLYAAIAYFIKTAKGTVGALTEYAAIIPTSVPALVLGMGILWMFVGLPLPVYGTALILLFAYFVRYMGYGVRQSRVALVQISEDLGEAARVSGAGQLRSFMDISLPLLRPSLLSLWTLMFINIFTEISATILLYSSSTRTLPVVLWNYMASGHITRAFAVAVLQATVILIVVYLADRRFGILKNTVGQNA